MKAVYRVLLLAVLVPSLLYAQLDTVYVPSDIPPGEGNLNTAVTNNLGNLNSKVFKLESYGLYILTATITIPAGQHLRIVADDPGTTQLSSPPQIMWSSSSGINTRFNFDCNGDITLKNIWLTFMSTSGAQVGSSVQFEDNLLPDPERGTFEGCIFDYSLCPANAGGTIGVSAPHFVGKFRNCYFRNHTDPHFRYYGRAVSFPFGTTGWHTDSLYFVNCTFANIGYVYMQEGAEYADYVWFNHCTFLNTVMFTLQSPWWWWTSVTNCVYQNAYMFGDIISLRGGGEFPNGGALTVDSISTFGFSVPFTEDQRHILFAHNGYYIEPWLVDYLDHGNVYSDTASAENKPHPQPMLNGRTIALFNDNVGWPYLSIFNNYENVNPAFLLAPTNIDRIKIFLVKKWTDNSDMPWAYDTASTINGTWPLGENIRIGGASPLKTAGMGGFPLGDLYHWESRSRYNQWAAQEATENATILGWLVNGVNEVKERPGVPSEFALAQNYPNPFNPVTQIDYSIPKSGYVSLKVYDMLGKEVATLYTGEQRPGNYTATFDGKNLPSGVYFYRLQTDDNSMSMKLVLMK